MKTDKKPSVGTSELRRQAEERALAKKPGSHSLRTHQETQRLVHELEIHQIELEIQNAELCRARDELEKALEMYTDLYDFAPVGYFTLDRNGEIVAVNLRGAAILGFERSRLIGRHFGQFVTAGERPAWVSFLDSVFSEEGEKRWEIAATIDGNPLIFAHIEAIACASGQHCRVAVTDITERRRSQQELEKNQQELEDRVKERTDDLGRANEQLTREVHEHKKTEGSLQGTFEEIKRLKDRLVAENLYLQQEVDHAYNFNEIIGQSNALLHVFFRIEQVAPQDTTILLLGETGTGKGVIARAIHQRSSRSARPMITVNCMSLPANLIESEIFGREKGAFTGANERRMGRFELADGGTIFLDEIGEMPLDLQSKLLRVVQDGEFERLGSPRTIKVNVRIIAASNRDLEEEIRNGRFREDLYYRLNVFPITVPPLRQRKEDIPLLVNHFVVKFNKKIGKKITTVPQETMNALQEYHWPGNVRELESVIERAVITSQGAMLQVLDRFKTFPRNNDENEQEVKALAELERDHIVQVLQKTNWRIEGKNGAAALLDLNPSTLRGRMRKYGIHRKYLHDL
ncbi:MAG: sigma 54-interacting transcriptional regulator [Desulfuromonadaceae bacterium]|nr:sigma 54-interacting transcriptional regulator [Desulfuromonadaceae bacterium]